MTHPAPSLARRTTVDELITDAKRQWQMACADGSSAARVQRLYEAYRDLVIRQAAAVVQGRAS